jgi:hypothetical protein
LLSLLFWAMSATPCQTGGKRGVLPNCEAWKWKNVKRKTDRDDALKLARLTLPEVHMPSPATRQKRGLLHYRQSLIGQRVAVQNRIRALISRGHSKKWSSSCNFNGSASIQT